MYKFLTILLILFLITFVGTVDAQRKSANYQIVDDSVAGVSIGEGVENFQTPSEPAEVGAQEMTRSDYYFFIFLTGLIVISGLILFVFYKKRNERGE